MPPRYAYWTILIDGKATAFRAKEREELLPTLNQLRRKNDDVALRYFSRGKLWDSPEQADWAKRNTRDLGERRDRDWRPGGSHRDPRSRFDKKPQGHRDTRAQSEREGDRRPRQEFERDSRGAAPPKPFKGDRRDGGWKPKPAFDKERAWSGKPPQRDRRDQNRPRSESSEGRPWTNEKSGRRPWSAKPERRGPWKPKEPQGASATRDSRSHPPKHRDDRRDNRNESRGGQWSAQKPWQPERRGDDRRREKSVGSRDERAPGPKKSFNRPDSSRPWIPDDKRSPRKERGSDERAARKPWVPKSDKQDRREDWKSAKPEGRKPAVEGHHRKPASPRNDRHSHRSDQQRRTGSRDEARGARPPRGETRRDDWRKRPDLPDTPQGPDERRESAPKPPREARPDRPPSSEQIVTKPEPPERG